MVHSSLLELVDDIRIAQQTAKDEPALLSTVADSAKRAVARKASWLTEEIFGTDAEQGYGIHLLHEEEDHSLAVMVIAWLPNKGAPPHDHGTWAVVVGLEGTERNTFFKRVDDGKTQGHARLEPAGEKVCGVGEVLKLPSGVIHSVNNDSDSVSVSLHIYGKNFNHTDRSRYDPESETEMPFKVRFAGSKE